MQNLYTIWLGLSQSKDKKIKIVLSTLCLLLWKVMNHNMNIKSLPPDLTDAILSHVIVRTKDIKQSQVSLLSKSMRK